jgi:predicted Zn-ribbon and HTH transcriptional regulator
MKGNDLIPIPTGNIIISVPAWCVIEGILKLSESDRADFATTIINNMGDNEESNELVLSVLRNRCRQCGAQFQTPSKVCFCQHDE